MYTCKKDTCSLLLTANKIPLLNSLFLNIKVSRTPRFDFIAHVIIIKYEYDFIYLLSTERLFDNYTTLIKKPYTNTFSGTPYFLAEGFLGENDKNQRSFMKAVLLNFNILFFL